MATALALVAAAIFALSTVLQQRGGLEAPPLSLSHPASFLRLGGHVTWLVGFVLLVPGWTLQAMALDRGRVADRMRKIASSPWVAVLAAGAVLANPGVFVPFALKVVSETDPSRSEYFLEWAVYTLVGLLPLAVAIVLLVAAREWTENVLGGVRNWLVLHARTIGAVLILALAASLLRGGIAGLT